MTLYPLLTAFLTGAIIMCLEILGFRLFAPYFGYSVYVWGSLIGIVMTALALGYYVGGRLADRGVRPLVLYLIILCAALYLLFIHFFFSQIASSFAGSDLILGTLGMSLIVYGPPMFALSIVSPFIIGIRAKMGHVGTTAGQVYGISTAGSILGTFLSAFYLLPSFGTKITLLTCFFSLLFIALFGILLFSRKALLLILLVPLPLIPHRDGTMLSLSKDKDILYDGQSRYSRLLVFENRLDHLITLQSTFMSSYSAIIRDQILSGRYYYWDFFSLAPLLVLNPQNALLLGIAGGVSLRQIHYFFPELQIDAVEIDEKVIEVGKKFFGLPEDEKIHLHTEDARPFIDHSSKGYDTIGIDLYGGGGSVIPFYVATKEFYTSVLRHLNDDGMVILNISGGPSKEILNTLTSVFPSVFQLKGISIGLAFPKKISLEEVKARLRQVNVFKLGKTVGTTQGNPVGGAGWDPEVDRLNDLIVKAWETVVPVTFDEKSIVFTDDISPIERLSYSSFWQGKKAK